MSLDVEAMVVTCRTCGASYDMDFDPPVECGHQDSDAWDVEIVPRSDPRARDIGEPRGWLSGDLPFDVSAL